jgi:hypothetical protein
MSRSSSGAMAGAFVRGDMIAAMRGVALIFLIGCGPVVYVGEVTRNASDAVEAARAARADKYSPYYWTRANEYLHAAREEAAHADFQGANRFGRLATEAATKAIEEAEKHPADTKPATAPAKTGIAPAKDGE